MAAIEKSCSVLVLGYGNPGRLDDGLGPALASRLERAGLGDVDVDVDYQLTVEDGDAVRQHDLTVFVDASVSGPEPFHFDEVQPDPPLSFSTHGSSPGAVLYMANVLLGGRARAFVLGIRGYEFDEFGEHLSPAAERNLDAAEQFLAQLLQRDDRRLERCERAAGSA